ncbi:MAG: hypothetical protein AAGD32_06510 [Planctomycetota bacterium]
MAETDTLPYASPGTDARDYQPPGSGAYIAAIFPSILGLLILLLFAITKGEAFIVIGFLWLGVGLLHAACMLGYVVAHLARSAKDRAEPGAKFWSGFSLLALTALNFVVAYACVVAGAEMALTRFD